MSVSFEKGKYSLKNVNLCTFLIKGSFLQVIVLVSFVPFSSTCSSIQVCTMFRCGGECTSAFIQCSLYRDGAWSSTIKDQLLDGALHVVG